MPRCRCGFNCTPSCHLCPCVLSVCVFKCLLPLCRPQCCNHTQPQCDPRAYNAVLTSRRGHVGRHDARITISRSRVDKLLLRPRQRRTRMQRPATLFGVKLGRWQNYCHEDMDLSVGADNMMRHVYSRLCEQCLRGVSLVRASPTIHLFKTLTNTLPVTHIAR